MNYAQETLFAILCISLLLLFIVMPYHSKDIVEGANELPSVTVVPGTSNPREFGSKSPVVEDGELKEEYPPIHLESSTGMYRQVLPGTYPDTYPLFYPGVYSVPLPNRYRYHQPYYHRLHTNYPYLDPVYDPPLETRDYCLRYPGCHPCPHWSWMSSPYCPRRRRV